MTFKEELVRHLTMSKAITDSTVGLEDIKEPLKAAGEVAKCRKVIFDAVLDSLGWEGNVVIEGEEEFKEMFAHHGCVLFAAALRELEHEIEMYAFMTEDGMPAHYYASIDCGDDIFFLDAYGIFEYESELTGRYKVSGQSKLLDFEDDDHPAVRHFRDFEADFLDELPGEDCGEQVEYAELYYENVLLQWSNALNESLLLKNEPSNLSM